NKYELLQLLGQGGFGKVWLARYKDTGQLVAVKIMHMPDNYQLEHEQQKAFERFLREIDIAQVLRHPHVLPALDYGYMQVDGHSLPYLVSPYVSDGSLADLIDKQHIYPWETWSRFQIADAIWQAAQALEYMHTRDPRIVHQDVKPGNFLLRWERDKGPERIVHLYLCDFGISRWQRTDFDVASQVLGTMGYMAPERVYGNITPAADQYSLAVVAHRLLTGKMPVYATEIDNEPVPPSSLHTKRVPFEAIDEVILRGLKFKPQERFPSVLAFGNALREAVRLPLEEHEEVTEIGQSISPPIEHLPAPVDYELPPIIFDATRRDERKAGQKPASVVQLPAGPKPAEKKPLPLESFNRQVLSKELPALPRQLSWSPDATRAISTFYNQQAPLLIDLDGKMEVLQHLGPAYAACWAPDGKMLAVSLEGNNTRGETQRLVRLWELDTMARETLTLSFQTATLDSLDWSTERQLAIWVENQLQVYRIPQRLPSTPQSLVPKTLTLHDMRCGSSGAMRWSPDGSLLATGANNGAVICWLMQTQRIQWQLPASGQLVYSVAWSPDSKLLAVAFSNKRIEVWDVYAQRLQARWTRLPLVPRMLSISTKQRLVIASDKEELLFGNLDDKEPSARYPGYWLAAWSPVDSKLATLDADKETELLIWDE
ncbi:MAG TPA: WD40 repeat domain-containing serine/threonine protein kinase, partial [Ktedonobacteraceae bacterium]|nr:WD40 repeat domain-containing serine/threonine protein kinase [Ktedonobacteraceae bacterium]